jgi:hypothetical protein
MLNVGDTFTTRKSLETVTVIEAPVSRNNGWASVKVLGADGAERYTMIPDEGYPTLQPQE